MLLPTFQMPPDPVSGQHQLLTIPCTSPCMDVPQVVTDKIYEVLAYLMAPCLALHVSISLSQYG